MKPLARQSLAEARRYREIAQSAASLAIHKPALANYILACIHAKDALCIEFLGRTGSSKRHLDAVQELSQIERLGATTIGQFRSLIQTKSDIQYDSAPMGAQQAQSLIVKAERFLDATEEILNGLG